MAVVKRKRKARKLLEELEFIEAVFELDVRRETYPFYGLRSKE